MPRSSPFPGMDPYLETPHEWPSFHSWFLACLAETLAASMPLGYRVDLEKRVYLEAFDPFSGAETRYSLPDITVVEHRRTATSGKGVAEGPPAYAPATIYVEEPTEVEETYIQIRDVTRNNAVVTVIELISPINKTPNTRGWAEFQAKRSAVTKSSTHWIELDFLHVGERPELLAGRSDYYTLLKRADEPNKREVCFFDVRDPMPVIAVPLRPEHADVLVSLQDVMNTCYSRARHADFLPYGDEAALSALRPADAQWAHEQIARWQAA